MSKKPADVAKELHGVHVLQQDIRDKEQQYIHRDEIWYFVRNYLIISGSSILVIVVGSIALKAFGRETLDAWSMSILISGSFGQLVSVLYLITDRVFPKN